MQGTLKPHFPCLMQLTPKMCAYLQAVGPPRAAVAPGQMQFITCGLSPAAHKQEQQQDGWTRLPPRGTSRMDGQESHKETQKAH